MKRIVCFGMAGVLLAMGAFAGGGAHKPVNDSGRIELRVLNYFDIGAANSAQEIPLVWEAFEKANPDIKLIREDLFNEAFHDRMAGYVAAGTLPDVVYAWPSGRSIVLHTNRLLRDLGPLIRKEGLASATTPVALNPRSQSGGYLGILPQAISTTHVFYVNTEVLKDAGLSPAKTYAELRAQVPILKARGYETILMANKDDWVMQSCLFSMIAGRFCGEGWERKILSGQAGFTDPDFIRALEFVKTLYDDGVIGKDTLTTDYSTVIRQFAAGKGAYFIDGDWRIGAFITDKATNQALISPAKQENILITVFPDIEGAQLNKSSSTILGTGWGMTASVPEGSAKEEAAWRLIKWLSGKEVQTSILNTGGIVTPTRTDINAASLVLEPLQKAGSNLVSQYEVGTVVIDGAFDSEVYTPINLGLQEIGLGAKTPRQVAETIQRAFETWKSGQ